MASRFIGKTSLAGLEPLAVDGTPVQRAYLHLCQLLSEHGLVAFSDLFAEPIITTQTEQSAASISWYTEASGEHMPLAELPPARRAIMQERLRQALRLLHAVLGNPQLTPLLSRALVLADSSGVLVVGDHIVLIGWGLAPAANALAPVDELLNASVLGPLMMAAIAERRDDGPAAAAGQAAPVRSSAANPSAAVANVAPLFAPAVAPAQYKSVWNWWLLPAAISVSLLGLLIGLWQGSRIAALQSRQRQDTVTLFNPDSAHAALDQQEAENEALAGEIERRRATLGGDVCQPNPADVPRPGTDHAAVLPPDAVPPPPPGAQPFRGNLAELLNQAVVVVLVPGEHGMVTGSGFFIAPDIIATNRHVVEHAGSAGVLVTSTALGHVVQAQVQAATASSKPGSADLALLRLAAPAGVQPLALTDTVAQLDPVIAAGYPGLAMNTDAAWQELVHGGNLNAVPALILTDGRISAIQDSAEGIKILPHSASVSGGNSGGPLVDACGRVVGINTFVGFDATQVAHVNYALKTDSLLAFVHAQGVAVTEASGSCAPLPARGQTPTPAPPASQAPSPPSSPTPN